MSGKWLSRPAVLWVLYEAPEVPPHLLSALLVVAVHAGADGRGAYVSAATVAGLTRKSESAAKRDLRGLEHRKLILRGDQRLAAHIRPDRRPVVYDLPMPERGSADATPQRGSADATPHPNGVAYTPERGGVQGPNGVAHTPPKEVLKTSRSGAARARAGGADVLTPENPHRAGYSAPPCPECGQPFSQEQLADPDFRAMALAGDVIHSECIGAEL